MAPKTPQSKQNIAHSLLNRAHSPETANTIFTEKVSSRPLYLKPTEGPNAQQTRRSVREAKLAARKKKNKPAPLSARQKRALCIYDIPKGSQKYSIYAPLNKMWVGYIQEIIGGLPVTGAGAAKLCSADFHGAEIEVVRSRCVSRVGLKGIVVRDLRGVFEVVTKTDKLKVVPKEGTVFRFCVPVPGSNAEKDAEKQEKEGGQVDGEQKEGEGQGKKKELVFELHGDQFMHRAADRANRKFKSHFLPDL